MYAKVDKHDKQINIYAKDDDLCYLCSNVEVCPLLGAIRSESVVLRYENIEVEKCGMYIEMNMEEIVESYI